MPTESTPTALPPAPRNPTPAERLDALLARRPDAGTFDDLFGRGRDLWSDEAEFERFLRGIEAISAER